MTLGHHVITIGCFALLKHSIPSADQTHVFPMVHLWWSAVSSGSVLSFKPQPVTALLDGL